MPTRSGGAAELTAAAKSEQRAARRAMNGMGDMDGV